MDWKTILAEVIYPALAAGLTLVVTLLLSAARDWIKRKAATDKHWAAAEIVIDAVQAILPDFINAIKDGKISAEEKNTLKAKAREIAEPRLRELRGFAAERLGKWLDHELEIALGKLLSGLGHNPPADTATIGPNDVATPGTGQ